MDYNEFNTILKNEKLNNICFDENNLLCNTVYLVKKENDFLVYTTDERAAVFGKVRTFQNEEEAYNNVLKSTTSILILYQHFFDLASRNRWNRLQFQY